MANQLRRSGGAAIVLALCLVSCASFVDAASGGRHRRNKPTPSDPKDVCASKPCGVTGSTTCRPDPADPTKAVCGCAFGWEKYNPVIQACSDIDECASGVGAELCGMDKRTRCTNAPKAGDPPICGCIYGFEDFNSATKTCSTMNPCKGNPCGTAPGVTCTPTTPIGTVPYSADAFVCGCAAPQYIDYNNVTKTCTNLLPICPGVNNIVTQYQPGKYTCLGCKEFDYWVNPLIACRPNPCMFYDETVIDNSVCVPYNWIAGYNIVGTTINTAVLGPTNITARNFCADLCQRTALCTFFVYNSATRVCTLKKDPLAGLPGDNNATNSQVSANHTTGFVAPSAGAIGPRYLCTPNVDIIPETATGGTIVPDCTPTLYPNNIINDLADEAACAAKCDNDCECDSYTWFPADGNKTSLCEVNYIVDGGVLDAYNTKRPGNYCWRLRD